MAGFTKIYRQQRPNSNLIVKGVPCRCCRVGYPKLCCGSNSGKGWDRALLQWDTGNAWLVSCHTTFRAILLHPGTNQCR